jgi:hypothetical protein
MKLKLVKVETVVVHGLERGGGSFQATNNLACHGLEASVQFVGWLVNETEREDKGAIVSGTN